ncbi:MAG: RHS repeat-associated core domain-containing protein [Ardenticatenaceae bacterium]|nr:RHS repeat-associated core domain-containing protein [Ardenticatenaceae bacterium]
MKGQSTQFFYDAAGMRVKTVEPNGTIIDTPFPGYEVENPTGTAITRRTYTLAGQAIAVRVSGDPVSGNNDRIFIYSDHLGSNSAMVYDTAGTLVGGSLTRYLPFGGYRGTPPSQGITDRDFTGQRENMELGLLYYQARYYLPGVGRFLSADTIVPEPINPQTYNRYAYVNNNPLGFIDPTGHFTEDAIREYLWGQCAGDETCFVGIFNQWRGDHPSTAHET